MLRLLVTEVAKLRGSLALVFLTLVPALPGLLVMMTLFREDRDVAHSGIYTDFVFPLWVMFLSPMAIATFVALMAQIEHRSNGWSQLLAMPIPRLSLFAAKWSVCLFAFLMMNALAILYVEAGIGLVASLGGERPSGLLNWSEIAGLVTVLVSSSLAFVSVLTWTALRWSNFVVPLSIGIAGTLVSLAVAMTRTIYADWFPWVWPIRVLMNDRVEMFALLGVSVGFVLMLGALYDLTRREFH